MRCQTRHLHSFMHLNVKPTFYGLAVICPIRVLCTASGSPQYRLPLTKVAVEVYDFTLAERHCMRTKLLLSTRSYYFKVS